MKKTIYLDHAATTPVSRSVLEAMLPYFSDCPGNASAVYGAGREARKAVEKARKQAAAAIGAEPREILFTSGGSESDNLALKGTAFALKDRGRHLITSAIEHPAVLNTCRWLEKQGFDVTYIQPDSKGMISPDKVRDAVRNDTILISVMAANNEIGTIEPVADIGAIAHEKGILFHTDAVQAVGSIPVNVNEWNADLLSLSAHKFHGPKGIGALYIRRGARLDPLIHGGEQERGLRAGTENVPGIAAMATALKESVENIDKNTERLTSVRNKIIAGLKEIPHSAINGDEENRLPSNVNFCFEGIEGESLLLLLDDKGIAASSGSACTSGSLDPSHVLLAIGRPHEVAHGSLRLS